jgi:hypothetical protein
LQKAKHFAALHQQSQAFGRCQKKWLEAALLVSMRLLMKNPFRYFITSPETIRLAVMMYVRFSLSRRNVEDLLNERGNDISHETVRAWRNRFGPMFAAEIRNRRTPSIHRLQTY